jgi:hypothetical protein
MSRTRVAGSARAGAPPVCTPETHMPTPVGEPCMECARLIREGEQGLTLPHVALEGSFLIHEHIACFRRAVGVPDDL